jgi:tol-pal system protein YbgF
LKRKSTRISDDSPIIEVLRAGSLPTLVIPALLGIFMGVGCAHQQAGQQEQVNAQQEAVQRVQSRLEEVERTNSRLNVRIKELEDEIFLLQDMTESNRIALRRRGFMDRGGYLNRRDSRAEAPQPAPESYYGSQSPYGEQQQRSQRDVTRIPLSSQQGGQRAEPSQQDDQRNRGAAPQAESAEADDDQDIVISEEEFRRFAGQSPSSTRSKRPKKSSKSGAQAPVTDEKLTTGAESAQDDRVDDVDDPFEWYKEGLAQYRRGDYNAAMKRFRAFLDSGPEPNYIDNALYWIGECHYGLGEFDKATDNFARVLRDSPDGNKVPDAMLKMSLAYERKGEPDKARSLLETLTDDYPSSNAGRLGAKRLSEMSE